MYEPPGQPCFGRSDCMSLSRAHSSVMEANGRSSPCWSTLRRSWRGARSGLPRQAAPRQQEHHQELPVSWFSANRPGARVSSFEPKRSVFPIHYLGNHKEISLKTKRTFPRSETLVSPTSDIHISREFPKNTKI